LGEVNGQPGAVFLGHDGRAVWVVSLDIVDGLVQAIRAVTNPDKLRHLGLSARGPRPLAR
jgi:RNA polymerase sigma-70 factor (ECF subfamily)